MPLSVGIQRRQTSADQRDTVVLRLCRQSGQWLAGGFAVCQSWLLRFLRASAQLAVRGARGSLGGGLGRAALTAHIGGGINVGDVGPVVSLIAIVHKNRLIVRRCGMLSGEPSFYLCAILESCGCFCVHGFFSSGWGGLRLPVSLFVLLLVFPDQVILVALKAVIAAFDLDNLFGPRAFLGGLFLGLGFDKLAFHVLLLLVCGRVRLNLMYLLYPKYLGLSRGKMEVCHVYSYQNKPVSFACDKWNTVEDNVWAIVLTLQAMRQIERSGASELLDRAFRGFDALPMPAGSGWWEVLEISSTASLEDIKTAYRTQVKLHHPDIGGDREQFEMIQAAYEAGIASKIRQL